ncbi:MAG: helix-hairpin-helix domain-containing protein [Crocinitomicaceae bacterium]|nr:helix-hairpin-helix domain-containing protein [Crocinitomicaceae bacterium]
MKAYFQFTRKQKIGVTALASVIIFLVVVLNVNQHRGLNDPSDVDIEDIEFVSLQNTENKDAEEVSKTISVNNNASTNENSKLFEFDPNTLNQEGWESLGFSQKQAQSIMSYRENYGPFSKPEDVQKIYVISDEKYHEIEPYMVFHYSDTSSSSIVSIEVNSATKEELEKINGIGPVFAGRTIKYREILGGYSSKKQFSAIYGITDDALKALQNNVSIDKSKIKRIKINSAPKDAIKKHPYLKDWEVVTAIISQRDKQKIEDLDFLFEQNLLTREEINDVLPYINFE